MNVHSYPSIFALGHRAIADLLNGEVLVQEKIDGSQFGFSVSTTGELAFRSKGAIIEEHAPPKMFERAVKYVQAVKDKLVVGHTYRGEVLDTPKHNVLAYDRTPRGNCILFDIEYSGDEIEPSGFLSYRQVCVEADDIGFEVVPLLYQGKVADATQLRALLETTSILGGQKIEGVVIKPVGYDLWGVDKKVLMGKFVSEAFKEVHEGEWKRMNPNTGDVIDKLVKMLKTPARWDKAVIHLREVGRLADEPKDIGPLLEEINKDILKEEKEMIMESLFKYAWPKISRQLTSGFPEWYKQKLLDKQFENGELMKESWVLDGEYTEVVNVP